MKRLQGPQRTVVQLVGVVLIMGGLSWASVPFYNWFCRVTGFGGTPGQVAEGVGIQAGRNQDETAHRGNGAGVLRGL